MLWICLYVYDYAYDYACDYVYDVPNIGFCFAVSIKRGASILGDINKLLHNPASTATSTASLGPTNLTSRMENQQVLDIIGVQLSYSQLLVTDSVRQLAPCVTSCHIKQSY